LGQTPLSGTTADGFRTHAHRFSVIVRTTLTDEQLSVVNHILETHRPAHTLVELCAVGAGLRVGIGAHIGLSSIVGASGEFATFRVGSMFGRDSILGRPTEALTVGHNTVGGSGRVG
jgi:hypothetical protein